MQPEHWYQSMKGSVKPQLLAPGIKLEFSSTRAQPGEAVLEAKGAAGREYQRPLWVLEPEPAAHLSQPSSIQIGGDITEFRVPDKFVERRHVENRVSHISHKKDARDMGHPLFCCSPASW
jgi:hypothetical protein